ncbi:MAG: NADH-quinone oxidoreductase subunit N [Proteobacteria bacterium]|nr:NADH-quinone oxidoreductase subunit N [Pseudomonadota bacterium]
MDYFPLLPEMMLIATGFVFFAATLAKSGQALLERAALALGLCTLAAACATYDQSGLFFYKAYKIDAFSQTFKILIALGLVLFLWMGAGLRGINRRFRPEYYMFLALSCLGLFLMTSAVELLTIVISIEISSYTLFVLIPLRRQPYQRDPLEASIKYFFLGAAATGITLYGMSYLFGLAHSTYLADIAAVLPGLLAAQPLAVIGIVMLLCGLFYKLALFPLHFWMPDVFEGAAHETTCFVATLPKIAAMALIVRIVAMAGPGSHQIELILTIMAVLSMFVGNFSAISQQDIKRLLAYSSIAHAGYMMVGIVSMNQLGIASALYYIYGYMLMNIACFTVLYNLAPQGENITVDGLQGLYRRSPLLAAVLAAGAIGLSGIPPTIGFTGKFMIFTAAFQKSFYWLVGLALLNVCISAFYYLRLVRAAYRSVEGSEEKLSLTIPAAVLGGLIIAGIVLSGILPQEFFRLTLKAVLSVL